MNSKESTESTEFEEYFCKKGYLDLLSPVQEASMLTLCQEYTGNMDRRSLN